MIEYMKELGMSLKEVKLVLEQSGASSVTGNRLSRER